MEVDARGSFDEREMRALGVLIFIFLSKMFPFSCGNERLTRNTSYF